MTLNPSRNDPPSLPRIVAAATLAALAFAAPAAAETELSASRIVLSATGSSVNNDEAQFKQRNRIDDDAIGGVEDLYLEWLVGDNGTLRLNGRAIAGNNDYLLDLKYDHTDAGFVSAGYREFRNWYDGSGGFFPPGNTFISYFDEDLALDRGAAWFEAGLRRPGIPELTLRYDRLTRDGMKSSSLWADTNLTGTSGTRNIVPTFLDVDEERDIVKLSGSHTLGNTELGLGLRYESSDLNNSRNARRRPNEIGPDRFLTHRDMVSTDLYHGYVSSSSSFNEQKAILSTAYSYTKVKNDLAGTRIYGNSFNAGFDPLFANRQILDEGFIDLVGATELKRQVGSVNLMLQVTDSLKAIAAVRVEGEDTWAASDFSKTTVGFPPTLTTAQEELAVSSKSDTSILAQRLEFRYTGIDNWVWFLRGEFEQTDGDLSETETETATSTVDIDRTSDRDTRDQRYTLGSVWYPHRRVNVAARYRYGERETDYDHPIDSTANNSSDRFPAFLRDLDRRTHSGDVRVAWTARDDLRMTIRYDRVRTEVLNRSDLLQRVESAEIDSNLIGLNATWNPLTNAYVQADVAYAESQTDTPADTLTGSATGLVTDFNNDYWNATLVSGIALNEDTEVQARYFLYKADNYTDNSAFSQPYGSDSEEHGVSLGLNRRLGEHNRVRFNYAYITNDEVLAGGRDDYEASIVTLSLETQF